MEAQSKAAYLIFSSDLTSAKKKKFIMQILQILGEKDSRAVFRFIFNKKFSPVKQTGDRTPNYNMIVQIIHLFAIAFIAFTCLLSIK